MTALRLRFPCFSDDMNTGSTYINLEYYQKWEMTLKMEKYFWALLFQLS